MIEFWKESLRGATMIYDPNHNYDPEINKSSKGEFIKPPQIDKGQRGLFD